MALPNQTIQMQSTNFFNMNNFNYAIAPPRSLSITITSLIHKEVNVILRLLLDTNYAKKSQSIILMFLKLHVHLLLFKKQDKSKYTFKCYLSAFSKLMLKTLRINKE